MMKFLLIILIIPFQVWSQSNCEINTNSVQTCFGQDVSMSIISDLPQIENYLHFNGSTDRVEIPTAFFGGGESSSFTIECWIRSGNSNMVHGTFYGKAAYWKEIQLGYPNGQFQFFYAYPYSYQGNMSGGGMNSIDWSHLAISMNGNQIFMHLNGVLIEQANTNGIVDWSFVSGSQNIGAGLWGGVMQYFEGDIKKFRISSIARYGIDNFTPSNSWISDNFTELLYLFNEGQGDILHDSSGNQHDGNILNAQWVSEILPTSYNWFNSTIDSTLIFTPAQSGYYGCQISNGIQTCADSIFIEVLENSIYYQDQDSDGFGDDLISVNTCELPQGYVLVNGDCNDANANINTSASEICNDIDDNCNSLIDDGLTFTNYYVDADNDGFGAGTATSSCVDLGAGYVTNNTDCNDSNASVNPAAEEIPSNGIDENCDGQIDNSITELSNTILLYPNPTTTSITLQVNSNLVGKDFIVYDAVGKVVLKDRITSTNHQISTSTFAAGNYVVKVCEVVKRFEVMK